MLRSFLHTWLFLCLEAADLQRMSDLADVTLQFLSVAVIETPNGSCLRSGVFIYCERKHIITACLCNMCFCMELNTTCSLFVGALKEIYRKVVSLACKKFLNSARAVPWICTCN